MSGRIRWGVPWLVAVIPKVLSGLAVSVVALSVVGHAGLGHAATTPFPSAIYAYDRAGLNVEGAPGSAPVVSVATPSRFLAAKALATRSDEAVFWSGIRGGADTASRWAASNGGATLESTMSRRGIKPPAWDASNPSSVAAWRSASRDFVAGARGNVRVLQDDAVRVNSIWAQVEYPALKANGRVTSITAVNPRTGATKVLWSR